MIDQIKKTKKVDADKYYSPVEIINMGLILNTSMQPCKFTLYRLIRNGTIKATKVGSGNQFARYKIKGSEIITFINNR
jgi:hypothetical protein